MHAWSNFGRGKSSKSGFVVTTPYSLNITIKEKKVQVKA
jgi:hypothetical protein